MTFIKGFASTDTEGMRTECVNRRHTCLMMKYRKIQIPCLTQSRNDLTHMSRLMTKPTKLHVRPAKTQISLGIRPVWSEASLCAQWVDKDPRFLHANSEDSDQTGRMPRLIWVFAGRTLILLVLTCRGSNYLTHICLVDSSILINWTSPFPILGVSGILLNFHFILIEIHVIKQCRPRSAFCGVWSGSTLFAWVPIKGALG